MTAPADRFSGWVDKLAMAWSARLGDWTGNVIGHGIERFADIIGKSYAKKLAPFITKMEETGAIPPELQPLIDEMKSPTGESSAMIANSIGNQLVSGSLGKIIDALLLPTSYAINNAMRTVQPDGGVLLDAYYRDLLTQDEFNKFMGDLGLHQNWIKILVNLKHVRFPSDVVGPAWLRDPAKYEKFWTDVRQVGVDNERIELLKEMQYRVPGVQDVIRYAVKEVYDPKTVAMFGQDQEYPSVAEEDARRTGVRPDHLKKEWMAHWDLPSPGQGFQMLHRGVINEDELFTLLKSLDVMPFWRDKLTQISWDVPNRVELRLMARYGLVDKPFLVKALEKAGLEESYRGTVADMMLAQGLLADLQYQYSKKWLTSDEVKAEIAKKELSPDIANRVYKWIVANAGADRTAAQKDLTKAEIIKGVKQGVISDLDAIDQLIALGYDEAEATYLLAIEVPQLSETPSDELRLSVDTIRRQRRSRTITRDQEITALVRAGVSAALATAYADNDDLRLDKASTTQEAQDNIKNMLEAQKVSIDTIRLARRQNVIDAATELSQLTALGVVDLVAQVYVENDNLRLQAVKVVTPAPVVDKAAQERLTVAIDTIRRSRRAGNIDSSTEVQQLVALGIDTATATVYAENDDLRIEGETLSIRINNEYAALSTSQLEQVDKVRQRRLDEITLHAAEVKELTALGISSTLAEFLATEDDLQLAR